MDFEELSPEVQEKAKACKTPEEMLKLAKEEGYELSEEELEAIDGGMEWCSTLDKPCEQYVRRWCPKLCQQQE